MKYLNTSNLLDINYDVGFKMHHESPIIMKCRRYTLLFIIFILIWGIIYLPILLTYHANRNPSIAWMIRQKNMNKYILPDNRTNLIEPKSVCNETIYLMVIVSSSIQNILARNAIRETWGNYKTYYPSVRVYYLIGTSYNETIDNQLKLEADKHGDIIQENFLDSYNNLTLKSVLMLKWFGQNCHKVNYVMKTDDDMFVNLRNLLFYLKKDGKKDKFLVGCLISNAVPIKDSSSKWFAPQEVYEHRKYPKYLSGTGYVMSRDVVSLLYNVALKTDFFYLEDIFLTGICAQKLGLERVNHQGFKFYKRKNDPCLFRNLITGHKMTPIELKSIWGKILNAKIKCPVLKNNATKKYKVKYKKPK